MNVYTNSKRPVDGQWTCEAIVDVNEDGRPLAIEVLWLASEVGPDVPIRLAAAIEREGFRASYDPEVDVLTAGLNVAGHVVSQKKGTVTFKLSENALAQLDVAVG